MPSVAIIGTRGYPSYYGGFETAVRRLAPYLANRGWDVSVYSRPGAAELEDPDRHPDVRVIETKGVERKSASTLTYGFTSTLHAMREQYDVALVMNVANGYWLPLLRASAVPTLVNVDGIEWDRAKWGPLAKAVFKTGARATARFADNLVFDSVEIGRRWREEFGRNGVFIPYGGDPARPKTDSLPHGLTRRAYALAVARFVPENTISEFLEAVPLIATRAPVVIVGSSGYGGPLDMRAASLARDHANVYWLGHVSDDELLHSLWANAGAYFHGHSVGGTNPALVQAMAMGAPTVARDTVYNREVLGGIAEFVQPDSHSIADAVTQLLANPKRQESLSEGVSDRARDHYLWDSVLAAYEQALFDLIKVSSEHSMSRVG